MKKLGPLREEVTYLRLQREKGEKRELDVNTPNTYLSSLSPMSCQAIYNLIKIKL